MANNEKAVSWANANGSKAKQGTFTDAAVFGEMIFNCTGGGVSLSALQMAGGKNLKGKVIVDVSNPLDFSQGMPPTLFQQYSNTTCVAEEIQKAYPDSKVVKTLNTVNCNVMVKPSLVAGEHDMFVCGNDADAKAKVKSLLTEFGWKSVVDLGDITGARGMEMYLPLWVRLMTVFKTPNFNIKIAR
jgi:predicted dinucleotide-binding enzyme